MRILALIFLACIAVMTGCDSGTHTSTPAQTGPGTVAPPSMPAHPAALYERWKEVVTNPEGNAQTTEHLAITHQLLNTAPETLDKMVDLLIDPTTKPESKFMILDCLGFAQTPELQPRLLSLVEPQVDPVIRTQVTMILARSTDPKIVARVRELVNDPERRVKLAALSGLTETGDVESHAQLREYFFTEGLPPEHRARAVQALSVSPEKEDLKVFLEAVQQKDMAEPHRITAVKAIGRLADETAVSTLETVAEDAETPEQLKQLATSAITAIQERVSASNTPDAPLEPAQ